MVICSGWNCLHPFGYVVDRDQNVQVPTRWGKWPHKVYTPTIENIYDKNRIEGHHVTPSDASKFLTIFTFFTKLVRIFKKIGQIEPTLEHLRRHFSSREVTTACPGMTKS